MNKSIKKVVGLKYKQDEGLPKVILKGHGDMADRILSEGKSLKGPQIVQDKKLLDQLYRLPIDAEIKPELFELVAILLVHVFSVNERIRGEVNE